MNIKRMRSIRITRPGRRMATAAGLLAISAATVVAVPGTASAATVAYNGACGSGYNVKSWFGIQSPTEEVTVYLTYSAATGKNCVVGIKDNQTTTRSITVYIERDDTPGSRVTDSGNYTKYAGPVYIYAKGACVTWGGVFNDLEVLRRHTNCGA
ncbi:spore-associated protein A [Kitasatospora sp. NPDC058063]|uniref:spore-associated protein A n=1 Tax=unclassified Kitasatospora TaxID=2633591 RepID=UPI0036DE7254